MFKLNKTKTIVTVMLWLVCGAQIQTIAQTIPADNWYYIEIDDNHIKWGDYNEPEWMRYFGLDMEDLNGDGYADIVAGREVYINPGGNMTGEWTKSMFPVNGDGILTMDVDGDEFADIIAQDLPAIYWLEAKDESAASWEATKVAEIVATKHVNSQGFEKADFIKGGNKEFVFSGGDAVYLIQIPKKPQKGKWPFSKIGVSNSEEGLGYGDLDQDGDLDVISGKSMELHGDVNILVWYENPGDDSIPWTEHEIGKSNHDIDRIEVGDLNGNGKLDIAGSEERSPGREPDAHLYWYEQPEEGPAEQWKRHRITTQYSMNNLDMGDIDRDGDLDLITNEHKGPNLYTQIWENDGKGSFSLTTVDSGKESHLGSQLYDMDGDGDLDNVSIGWDKYQYVHLWRNDAINTVDISWKHYSSTDGHMVPPNEGDQQTASIVADLDKDGINDFVIAERTAAPAVVWYKKSEKGWDRHIIEDGPLRIEAGSAWFDIDDDGDTDVVFAGDSKANGVWWWENPYPNFDKPWKRRAIKDSGENKHHDQIFGDFDGDGKAEFVFWNQLETCLFIAEIPDDPRSTEGDWERKKIYSYTRDSQMWQRGHEGYPGFRRNHDHEGLAKIDIDGDGVLDIVGGGRWFKYVADGEFSANVIDASYVFTRSAVGDFIEGGRPEVVMVVGDGIAKVVLYEYKDGTWIPHEITNITDNGHTLETLDFNGDGHLDLFNAEMGFKAGNPKSRIRIMLGDGKGNFTTHYVATGFGLHESRIADLDGDGDFDVMGKPYEWEAPRLDVWINESK